jgi:hypothetical protein
MGKFVILRTITGAKSAEASCRAYVLSPTMKVLHAMRSHVHTPLFIPLVILRTRSRTKQTEGCEHDFTPSANKGRWREPARRRHAQQQHAGRRRHRGSDR